MKAKRLADRIVDILKPFCDRIVIAGSIRRECILCNDIEVICSPYHTVREGIGDLFNKSEERVIDIGFVKKVNEWNKVKGEPTGRYTQRELPGGVILDLFIPQRHDWGRQVAIRTGSAFFSKVKLAARWSRMGWKGTKDGLRRTQQCRKGSGGWDVVPAILATQEEIILPPEFPTEKSFWDFLELEYVPPQDRNWQDKKKK